MNASPRRLFMGLTVALFFTLAFAALADTDQAQQSPPLHEVSSAPAKATPPPAPAVAPAPAAPTTAALSTAPAVAASSDKGGVITTTSKDDGASVETTSDAHHGGLHRGHNSNDGDDRVAVMNDNEIGADEHVTGDAVCVMGNLTVNGEVDGDAVCVMGDSTINSHVHGQVVCVGGTLHLGPKAETDGEIDCVGGEVVRDPGAIVHRPPNVQIGAGSSHLGNNLSTWVRRGPVWGRMLAFGPGTIFMWMISFASLVVMVLLALAFPKAVDTCGQLITQRPGMVLLTGLLSLIALPFVFLLLCVTVVGIPIAVGILPIAVMLAKLFGVAAIFMLVGRAFLGRSVPAALACLVVGLIYLLLLAVPVLGLTLYLAVGFLGFGAGIAALLGSFKSNKPPKQPPVQPTYGTPVPAPVAPAAPLAAPAGSTVFGEAPAVDVAAVETPVSGAIPPLQSPPIYTHVPPPVGSHPAALATSLPRAGFWVRIVALVIDMILVGIVVHIFVSMLDTHNVKHDSDDAFLFFLATYAVCLWKARGTTVGGLIFHLKVVRLDDRPIDWPTAVVRGLGCFLSAAVAFLGFIWIAFDDEKQAWHDKIAGTVVVQAPKGTPLV